MIIKRSHLTAAEIPLSNWNRTICENVDYPAFGDPEPVILPDMLTEQMSDFSGFACYETTFELRDSKSLALEISDSIGGVEVFLNGETLGIHARPPHQYDLSSLTWQGKNYLAIEVAIDMKQKCITSGENNLCIIGNVQLFIKADIP
jgi:hypothetical protein